MKRRAFLASMGISLIQTAMAATAGLAEEKPTTVPMPKPTPAPTPKSRRQTVRALRAFRTSCSPRMKEGMCGSTRIS